MITTGNTIVSIYTEMTPNPETMKFVANKLLYPGKSIDIAEERLAIASPLAKELFSFPFIKSVFIASNFITLTKSADTEDWQDVIPTIKTFLKEYLENGGVVVNEEEVAKIKQEATNTVHADDDDIVKCNDNYKQCRTAASKLQIRLNDLINRHKAPLQMYDDIVTLFNE
mgnify:CR=1 FL=1